MNKASVVRTDLKLNDPLELDTSAISISQSSIHGSGVFAARAIKKGERIIEYVGDKIRKKESTRRALRAISMAKKDPSLGAVYIFELDDTWDIDGNVEWNPARLINHSCDGNCEASIQDGHIWILALRDIKKGEELGYNYGYDLEHYAEHPCRCGSANCVGYIVAADQWDELKKILLSKNVVNTGKGVNSKKR